MERKNIGKNLIKKTTHVLKIKENNIMQKPKAKKVMVSMTEEIQKIAKEDSVEILGNENLSGYVSYLINKARKER